MNRDEAVRIVAAHLIDRDGPDPCSCSGCLDVDAKAIVDALVAAGWGDLLDEQLLTAAEKGRAERAEAEVVWLGRRYHAVADEAARYKTERDEARAALRG
jgi:hypothetical protein